MPVTGKALSHTRCFVTYPTTLRHFRWIDIISHRDDVIIFHKWTPSLTKNHYHPVKIRTPLTQTSSHPGKLCRATIASEQPSTRTVPRARVPKAHHQPHIAMCRGTTLIHERDLTTSQPQDSRHHAHFYSKLTGTHCYGGAALKGHSPQHGTFNTHTFVRLLMQTGSRQLAATSSKRQEHTQCVCSTHSCISHPWTESDSVS